MSTPTSPLRLVLVAHRFEHNDGQGRVNYEVARAALDRGFAVTLLSAYCADELVTHPRAHFVRIGRESLPTQLLRNLAFANQSARWLKLHRGEFDLVQANGFITWEACDIVTAHFVHTAWARNSSYPYAGSLRPYSLYQRAFTELNAHWERRAFLTARHVIAVSGSVAEDLQRLGVARDRIEVIYNGVDTDAFRPGASERESFGLPLDVDLALFAGDIRTTRKNLDTVLRAMQSLPGMHLAVAGDTKGSPFPELARELKVADRVHFIGRTSKIALLMRSVDLFVFPSRYEPFGLVVLEAMASGLPVIISKKVGFIELPGELLEVLEDPEDAAALASSIAALLASPERRKRMGEMARERALTLSWSHTAEGYLRAYEALHRQSKSQKVAE